jgi:glycosyltransferase involved in cell wall biosynthesis
MVPYEAFLAEKPVVTTTDAGGPLEVVADRSTGIVCEPSPDALAAACSWLRDHVDDARAFGQAGKRLAEQVSWDTTIARLLA